MYPLLTTEPGLLDQMAAFFTASSYEEGFLLGCSTQINHLTHAVHLPSSNSGLYHYEPNSAQARQLIRIWADLGICFCGFIHSHVRGKRELSEDDLEFAETLIRAYNVPLLWFGLAVISDKTTRFIFYSLTLKNGCACLTSVPIQEKSDSITGGY